MLVGMRLPLREMIGVNMKTVVRNILAVLVGIFVGGLVNMMLVVAGPHVIPPPPGVDMGDMKSLTAGAHLLEPRHFLFPFLAHALGTLAGALTANVLGSTRRPVLAFTVGAVFLAGGIAASFMVPAPGWFIALDLVMAYLPMAWLAARLGRVIRP